MRAVMTMVVVMILLFLVLNWRDSVENVSDYVMHDVPFICQAPMAEWDDYRHQDGCEEACGAMALSWVRRELILAKEVAKKRILDFCEYEEVALGFCEDTGVDDTVRMIEGFWEISIVSLWQPTVSQLKTLLRTGHIMPIPINGTLRGLRSERIDGDKILLNYNLHESDRHMVLLIGYNDEKGTFIVHDPGTKNGACYNFDQQEFVESICDYPSGSRFDKKSIDNVIPRFAVVSRE